MKYVCVIVALSFSFACIANPKMRTHPKRAPLTGKVKTVREYALRTANEKHVREFGRNNYTVDSYSNSGLKLLRYYIQSGKLTGKTLYLYNDKEQLIEEKYLDDGINLQSQKKYSYDTSGKLVLQREFNSGHQWMEIRYTYIEGLLTKKTYSAEYMQRKVVYKYDEKGRMIVMIEITDTTSDSRDMVTRYSYYDNGNMRSETYVFSFGDDTTTYTYDEHNNEILAVESTGRRFASKYVYDKQGNWIHCLEEVPNDWYNDQQLTIREIVYY